MCEPTTIMAALAVVSTAAQVVTEIKSANHQNKAIAEQLTRSEQEITDKQTAELNDRAREARREQAKIKVAAGEAGLSLTGSVESLLTDTIMQQGLSAERTNMNAQSETEAARAEANSMWSRVQKPTLFGAGLRIASSGLNGYAAGKSMTSQAATPKAGA